MATVSSIETSAPLLNDQGDVAARQPLTSDERFYEVIDGKIVELPPMGVYESWIAAILDHALGPIAKSQKLGRVVFEILFWLDRSRKLKRRPDLAFVSAARWSMEKRIPKGEAWDVIPDLAIEVISDSNGANEIAIKLSDYFNAGVQQVWVVYPPTRQVYVYSSLTSVEILPETAMLDGGSLIPGFHLPLSGLFGDEPESETAEATSE
jgi:Uma2 family endonuclease